MTPEKRALTHIEEKSTLAGRSSTLVSPTAVGDMEVSNERVVYDGAFATAGVEGVLGHEVLTALAGTLCKEGLEGGADGGFVGSPRRENWSRAA